MREVFFLEPSNQEPTSFFDKEKMKISAHSCLIFTPNFCSTRASARKHTHARAKNIYPHSRENTDCVRARVVT